MSTTGQMWLLAVLLPAITPLPKHVRLAGPAIPGGRGPAAVPLDLEEIPYTGMIAYPEFSYRKDCNDNQPSPGSYDLRIECTNGPLNFDRFIYWPSETYPDRIQDKVAERIHKWVYVHE
jgi:hypothetical protein